MSNRNGHAGAFDASKAAVFSLLAFLAAAASIPLAAVEATPPSATTQDQGASADELLRSYLQLQEQLHSLQLAVDKNRQDASATAEKGAQQMAGRLDGIERALDAQRARELEAMQSSNRVMLTVAGTFAGVGLLAMVCMAYFQWRTINRLAEISAALPAARLLGPGSAGWAMENRLLPAGAAEQSNSRLMGNLERLEKRLVELEHTAGGGTSYEAEAAQASTAETPNHGNGGARTSSEPVEETKLSLLLAKGQSLLNMDRAEEALAAFDDALKTSPNHPEALLKRATALERLGQLEQALECCDRAIVADRTSTMAYLQKGGLYNRMERFEEAIRCYEAALRVRG